MKIVTKKHDFLVIAGDPKPTVQLMDMGVEIEYEVIDPEDFKDKPEDTVENYLPKIAMEIGKENELAREEAASKGKGHTGTILIKYLQ